MRFSAVRGCLLLTGVTLISPLKAQIDVLTYRYDNARSGANLNETKLKKSNVKKQTFGKLAFRIVDGNIYAQPLIVTNAKIANRANPVNIAVVATEHNSVYAFDTDDVSADPGGQESPKDLWHTGPGGPQGLGASVDSLDLSQQLGAGNCTDITTEVGITSTPVIRITPNTNPKEGVVFVTAKSKAGNQFSYKLFALNLANGQPLGSGVAIDGSVTGPNGTIEFDALHHLNRPALLLDQNILYIAFGGHCDVGDYRGWVFAYDVSNAAAPQKLDAFSATFTPRNGGINDKNGRAGIWMSGYGPASADGSVYFATGDGTFDTSNPTFPQLANSVVKVKLVGGKIQVQDFYTPQNQAFLKALDADLGSGGPVPLPNSHLLLAGGKEGRLYLIDRNDMGHGVKLSIHSLQATNPPRNRVVNPTEPGDTLFWNIHGAPVVWARTNETFAYVMGEEDFLRQYRLTPDAGPAGWKFTSDTPFKKSKSSVGMPPGNVINDPTRNEIFMPGGFLTLSASGTDAATGIVWATMPFNGNANHEVVRGALRAFDASDVSKGQLWGSEDTGNPNDGVGFFAKFNPPVVANGKVFIATFQQENIDNGIHKKNPAGLLPALVMYGLK